MILDFNLMVTADRPAALEERDNVIDLLKANGYHVILATGDNGTRVLMGKQNRLPKEAGK